MAEWWWMGVAGGLILYTEARWEISDGSELKKIIINISLDGSWKI